MSGLLPTRSYPLSPDRQIPWLAGLGDNEMTTTPLVADKKEWEMLYFPGEDCKENMAKFVNALTEKFGDDVKGQINVGINAINVETGFFDEIKDEFKAEEFDYVRPGMD
jgi:hypothetical protein